MTLNNYYDTGISDDARIGIVFTHILNDNRQGAKNYLNSEQNRFLYPDKYEQAEILLKDSEEGLKLAHYYQLYK